MCSCTPKISCTTSTVGNGPPVAGIARYAGISPPLTGILTSPATSPLLSVVIVSADTGITASANPAARLPTTNARRESWFVMLTSSVTRSAGTQGCFAHETGRFVEVADAGVGAKSLRHESCRRVAEPHAFRRRPSERQCTDEAGAIRVAASRGVDHLDLVRGQMNPPARGRHQAAFGAHRKHNSADAEIEQSLGSFFGCARFRQSAGLIRVRHEPIDERQARLEDREQLGRALAQDIHAGGRSCVARAPEDLRRSVAAEPAHRIGTAEMQMGSALDQRPWNVIDRIDGVGADRMKRGPISVGPYRKNARRGLNAALANDVARIDAVAVQRTNQHVAERVTADCADRRDHEAQFRQTYRGARSRSRRREPNLIKQQAALSFRDVRDVAAENIQDVRAERHYGPGHQ